MKKTMHRIKNGIDVCFIKDSKFKTYMASVLFHRPLKRDEASKISLLAQLLKCANPLCPGPKEVSAALEELYGASLQIHAGKRGEEEILRVAVEGISDEFLPECAFEKSMQMLFASAFNGGDEKYLEQEKKNLVDRIKSQINDKRFYGMLRLNEIMFADEPYGVNTAGYADEVEKITADELADFYREVKNTSKITVIFTGNFDENAALKAVEKAVADLPERSAELVKTLVKAQVGEVKRVVDHMDVTQGKLSIGMRTGIGGTDPLVHAQMVFSAIYGGGTSSKLFCNVREKLSLCYYASSWADRMKGWIRITSGIEFENYQKAYDEIMYQLELMKKGELTEKDMDTAKKELVNAFRSRFDSVESLEDYNTMCLCLGTEADIEKEIEKIESVTKEDVVCVAQKVVLDTVYFLAGKEEA